MSLMFYLGYYNVSIKDEKYEPVYNPLFIEI